MQEHTFYSNGNVAVTSARFMVGGETYAMNSIASVRAVKDDPERDWGCLGWVLVLGIGLIFRNRSGMGSFGRNAPNGSLTTIRL